MASQAFKVIYPNLPLAIYLEIATHLRQIQGVKTQLLTPHTHKFNYLASQVGGLEVAYASRVSHQEKKQVEQILNYYSQLYGAYELG